MAYDDPAVLARVQEVQATVEAIRPMLAGRSPEVQSGVLADLTSMWLAGMMFNEDVEKLRTELLANFLNTVLELIPVNEQEILARYQQGTGTAQ